MDSTCAFSPSRFSSFPSRNLSKIPRTKRSFYTPSFSISCHSKEEPNEEETAKKNGLKLLQLTVTLTVISSSLPQLAVAAKVSEKKRSSKKSEVALSPEEVKSWLQGLPVVSDRIPYTEILNLKEEGKLKHIVKLPSANLKQQPESVLVVLEDSRVLTSVLPMEQRDAKFWQSWDGFGLDSICVNAYTPPVKRPELPRSYFGFLTKVPEFVLSVMKPKPLSKKALELEMARRELKGRKNDELERLKVRQENREREEKAQKKMEEKKKRQELRRIKYEESLRESRWTYESRAMMWATLARDQNVSTALGVFFFYIFYRTVVYNYKKQQKDYDDRLKIEKADAEERRKMKELENELEGIQDGDENEEGKSETNPYLKMAMQFMKSGARVRRAQNRRLPQFQETGIDVKFTDVAGIGKIRIELEEVVKFFTHGEMYRRRGVKIPGGILLCGPPGVGKTLLAKAVAGEAGVNFFSISASQFVEIYVGVGASRVRALYQEAKDNAPSVVFIDELDAVGRERGLIKGSGGQERDATLNQLLVCLDGFEGRGEVITIAATNRPDILDPALVRPGRFDRKIYIPKPGVIGRIEILKVHARKKPIADDVDYMAVAGMTEGMVGAELANIIEVAAINMMRDGRPEITTDDLIQAAQIEERGMLERKERSKEAWKQLAINELSMAVVAVNFPDLNTIEFITIAPRAGRELGYVRVKMDHVKFNKGMLSRQSLLDHITVQLAPRAADEIWYGKDNLSTIWAETGNNARSAARTFVLGGLSEKHYGLSDFWVADRINEIDLEALNILNTCYQRAKEILQRNRRLMDAVVDELAEKKSLTKQEFFHLVNLHGSLEPKRPSILDIRVTKRKQLQEKLMKK